MRHAEYFHDHVRIERMFFDGNFEPVAGALVPDLSRPGMGLELKRQDIEQFSNSLSGWNKTRRGSSSIGATLLFAFPLRSTYEERNPH